MKGTPRSAATRWIASAIFRACASDSITHGPAIRNSLPRPTATPSTSKLKGELTLLFDHNAVARSEAARLPTAKPTLPLQSPPKPRQQDRRKREPAPPILAHRPLSNLPHTRRLSLQAVLRGSSSDRIGELLHHLRIKLGQDLRRRQQVANPCNSAR